MKSKIIIKNRDFIKEYGIGSYYDIKEYIPMIVYQHSKNKEFDRYKINNSKGFVKIYKGERYLKLDFALVWGIRNDNFSKLFEKGEF